jgi:hypothetical protein
MIQLRDYDSVERGRMELRLPDLSQRIAWDWVWKEGVRWESRVAAITFIENSVSMWSLS